MKTARSTTKKLTLAKPSTLVVSLQGYEFDLAADVWKFIHIGQITKFRFDSLGIEDALKQSFKQTVGGVLAKRKIMTGFRYYEALASFLRFCAAVRPNVFEITLDDLSMYWDALGSEATCSKRVTLLGLKHWVQLRYPGLTAEAAQFVRDCQLEPQSKGTAVRIRCPIRGAYSELEFSAIQSALHAAYAAGEVSDSDYGLAILSLTIAPRPVQISLLRAKHLIASKRADGSTGYVLKVTRVKQRDNSGVLRSRKLSDAVGAVLEFVAARALERAREIGRSEDEAPLFWSNDRRSGLYEGREAQFEISPSSIGMRLRRTLGALQVRSERTGTCINVTSTRSRRTLGTRAAAEGKGALLIAELLDHSEASSARPYIEARPEMLTRIDKAVALHLAPLAQRFAGKLAKQDECDDFKRHVYGGAPGQCPSDLGGCGKHSFCGLVAPLACYTCLHFRPWLEAPHEDVLSMLIHRRESAAEVGSLKVASGLDETILAVAQVVLKVRSIVEVKALRS